MSTVQVKLNSRYDSITRHVEAKGEERAIAPFKKQYKGICGNCGEIGHKKSGCLKNKSRDKKGHDRVTSRGFKGKCFYCRLFGHKRADCCKEKKDQETKTYKTAKAAINEIDEECKSEEDSFSELGFVGKDESK